MYQGSRFTFLAVPQSLQIEQVLEDVAIETRVDCICLQNTQELLESILEYTTDLIILHTAIGIEIIHQTLKTLQRDEECKEIPLYILCSQGEEEALSLTFKEYPIISMVSYKNWQYQLISVIRFLKTKNQYEDDLHESLQESETQNQIDPLTGALNRYGAEHKFEALVADFESRHIPFSIIMFDLDFFKKINDQHGHDVGDEVLVSVSSLIQHDIRKDDALIRFGGEEFIIFLSKADKEVAKMKAEGFREAIQNKGHGMDKLKVTASFGVREYIDSESLDKLISKVDKLLYQAKEEGRNRVVF